MVESCDFVIIPTQPLVSSNNLVIFLVRMEARRNGATAAPPSLDNVAVTK